MTDQAYIAAPNAELGWRYEVPQRTDAKVQLLTIGRTTATGNWYGRYGEHFIAWCPLPKRDKRKEAELIAAGLIPPPWGEYRPEDEHEHNPTPA
jgi:hypothetical protein